MLDTACVGKSLEEIKRTITLGEFGQLGQYGVSYEFNTEGTYCQVSPHRRNY